VDNFNAAVQHKQGFGADSIHRAQDGAHVARVLREVGNSTSWFTVAILVVGVDPADLPAWGGELLVAPLFTVPVALYPGTTDFPGSVAPNELLAGVPIYLQALELDAGAPRGVSFTPGLMIAPGF